MDKCFFWIIICSVVISCSPKEATSLNNENKVNDNITGIGFQELPKECQAPPFAPPGIPNTCCKYEILKSLPQCETGNTSGGKVATIPINTIDTIIENKCGSCHNLQDGTAFPFCDKVGNDYFVNIDYLLGAISPENPSDSILYNRLKGADVQGTNRNMPPGVALSQSELDAIKLFIEGVVRE